MDRPPKHYAKGANRRKKVIQAATRIFCDEGLEGATFKRVAEVIGLREPSLYYYFRGKQDLLCAVLEEQEHILGNNRGDTQSAVGVALPQVASIAKRTTETAGLAALLVAATATANSQSHEAHGFFP